MNKSINQDRSAPAEIPPFLHYASIIFLTFFCYANTWHSPFLYDDEIFIQTNRFLKNPELFLNFFTKSAGAGAYNTDNFYRPLQLLSYGILYQFFEFDTRAYHALNILTHTSNALLVYYLINLLFKNRSISFFTALIFAIHPVHTEAVSYINGLAEPLFLFFSLLSVIFFVKSSANRLYYLASALANILAVLSKETAIVVPFVLIAVDIYLKRFTWRRVINYFPSLLISSVFIYLRLGVLHFGNTTASFFNPYSVSDPYSESILIRFYTFAFAVFEYLKILFFPFDLKYDRLDFYVDSLNLLQTKLGIGFLFGFAALAILSLRSSRLIFLCYSWAMLFIAPVSFIVPINGTMKEHWLYAPAIGFSLGLVLFIKRYLGKIQYLLLPLILFILIYGTIERNRIWKDPISFYNSILAHNPIIARVHNNLAKLYDEEDKDDYAEYHYKKAIELADLYSETHHNLAMLFLDANRVPEAIEELEKALAINDNFIYSHLVLEEVYRQLGDSEKAAYHRERIKQINGE